MVVTKTQGFYTASTGSLIARFTTLNVCEYVLLVQDYMIHLLILYAAAFNGNMYKYQSIACSNLNMCNYPEFASTSDCIYTLL